MSKVQFQLNVKHRETGKKAVKATRNENLVPGIFYTKGDDAIPFAVNPLDIRPLVYTAETKIINLKFDSEDETREGVLKQVDFDPVTDKIVHIDIFGFTRGQKMNVDVPINLLGAAKGLKEGGLLQHPLYKVSVECLPKDLPSHLEINIEHLGIGDSVFVKDLDYPKLSFNVPEDTVIASIVLPRVVTETTAEDLGEGVAEGEEKVAEDEEKAAE
ncbi:MAG: 50S ribosomal protein L25 [Chlorobi bacterium]|nr:50S ribosomal protein L25 [Chlorobiota bacterium]